VRCGAVGLAQGLLVGLILSSLSAAGDPPAAPAALRDETVDDESEGWEPVSESGGISVLSRARAGSAMREIRALGEVSVDAERLFAVLGDIERYPEIMPPTIAARRLSASGTRALFYLVIDPPVVSKRDYCIQVDLSRLDRGALQSRWRLTEESCPTPSSRIVRMRSSEGRWLLRPLGPGRTLVDYLAHTDPGGSLPAWLVNRSVGKQMRGMFEALAKAGRHPRYARCRAESFGCADGNSPELVRP
jgi:hypothetical protein